MGNLAIPAWMTVVGISVVVTFCGCSKASDPHSDNGLPPLSAKGVMMFACRVNGVLWISKLGDKNLNAVRQGDSLSIYGTVADGQDLESVGFFLLGVYDSTKLDYLLTDTATAAAYYTTTNGTGCFNSTGGYGVIAKEIPNGRLSFIKTTDGIAAGTFSFYVPRDFCDTLFITDGRFDVQYSTS